MIVCLLLKISYPFSTSLSAFVNGFICGYDVIGSCIYLLKVQGILLLGNAYQVKNGYIVVG